MKGYKVLYIDETDRVVKRFTSFFACQFYDLEERNYQQVNCGPLAVFDTLENANLFLKDYIRFTVYEVDYDPSEETVLYTPSISRTEKDELPLGTCFAKSLVFKQQIPSFKETP